MERKLKLKIFPDTKQVTFLTTGGALSGASAESHTPQDAMASWRLTISEEAWAVLTGDIERRHSHNPRSGSRPLGFR